jgi:hypothetical protein
MLILSNSGLQRPPLIAAIAIVAMCTGTAAFFVLWVLTSRKRQKVVDAAWVGREGRLTTCISVEITTERELALRIAQKALERIKGTELEIVGDDIVGWTRVIPIVGWLGWAPQQIAIAIRDDTDGQIQLICCSRPRLTLGIWDLDQNRRVANRLAEEVRRLASESGFLFK